MLYNQMSTPILSHRFGVLKMYQLGILFQNLKVSNFFFVLPNSPYALPVLSNTTLVILIWSYHIALISSLRMFSL